MLTTGRTPSAGVRVALLLLWIVAASCDSLAPEERTFSLHNIWLNCTPQGFGWHCTGYADVDAEPALDSGIPLVAVLNGSSIDGQATSNGNLRVRIPLDGGTIACPFVNPSTLVLHDQREAPEALAFLEFTWSQTGCG